MFLGGGGSHLVLGGWVVVLFASLVVLFLVVFLVVFLPVFLPVLRAVLVGFYLFVVGGTVDCASGQLKTTATARATATATATSPSSYVNLSWADVHWNSSSSFDVKYTFRYAMPK